MKADRYIRYHTSIPAQWHHRPSPCRLYACTDREMTAHHGSAMIYASYAHLDLFPETLTEPWNYFCETPEKESPYTLFVSSILNMEVITEARLLANLRAHVCPAVFVPISPLPKRYLELPGVHPFYPRKRTAPLF